MSNIKNDLTFFRVAFYVFYYGQVDSALQQYYQNLIKVIFSKKLYKLNNYIGMRVCKLKW